MVTMSKADHRRKNKGATLAALGHVRESGFGWNVTSETYKGTEYRVTRDETARGLPYVCTCPDQHAPCKHAWAVAIQVKAENTVIEAAFTPGGSLQGLADWAMRRLRSTKDNFEARCMEVLWLACAREGESFTSQEAA